MSTAGLVKCVVWDLDNTLLQGTYLDTLFSYTRFT